MYAAELLGGTVTLESGLLFQTAFYDHMYGIMHTYMMHAHVHVLVHAHACQSRAVVETIG